MADANKAADDITASDVLAGKDVSGKTVIVTGASSGVGIGIARAFAKAGADVTLPARNLDAVNQVADDIAKEAGKRPRVMHLDLLSMKSVRAFAKEWGDAPLDLLINNAGLMAPPLTHTEDGFESQMSVNFYAPFLLSELLVPALKKRAPSRVVMVSSGSHHGSKLRLDDLNYHSREYEKFEGYGHAKLCANLLGVEFSKRHAADGIVMNAVTPGGVMTALGRHSNFEDAIRLGWINEDGTLPQGRLRNIDEGAASPTWAAVAPELNGRGGLYVEDCAIAPFWTEALPPGWGVTRDSLDPADAARLWDLAYPAIQKAGL
jgi:NAD(P)-dependent dehydrogenase (short-subunit alcohol dehydrogenase family)